MSDPTKFDYARLAAGLRSLGLTDDTQETEEERVAAKARLEAAQEERARAISLMRSRQSGQNAVDALRRYRDRQERRAAGEPDREEGDPMAIYGDPCADVGSSLPDDPSDIVVDENGEPIRRGASHES